ncbi:MAG: hypothetical protein GC182_20780 [Rhodopseudomonas sp.]|nr:hypothetical protein [Rhodopseudomonas sp.]
MNGPVDPAVAFLERLLILTERSPNRTRAASAAPEYDALLTAEMISRFEQRILAAERSGAVQITRGKRERKHLIERVVVRDAAVLACHLGRTPASQIAASARRDLESVFSQDHPWLPQILAEMEARWSRGEAAYRIAPTDLGGAREFLALLEAISTDQAKGLDARTFSLKVTGDSKAFDRHASRIASVVAVQIGKPGLAADAVWARVGLERFSHPVHLHGPLVAEDRDGVLADGRARPFASLHPELLPLIKLSGQPSYILTVENYASFNRHVREIEDGGLVIYTGGFASNGVIALLRWLLNSTEAQTPFYHWGDIDPGGLRIFRYLEENLPRPPLPHLMEQSRAEAQGRSAMPDATLAALAKSASAVAPLAEWLSCGEGVKHLEQETTDPASPPFDRVRETAA